MKQVRELIENAWRIHVAANIVRIPPSDIQLVAKHTAINTGTATLAAFLLLLANSLFVPGAPLGLSLAIVASVLCVAIIVLFGFGVNLLSPAGETFEASIEERASGLANRWATYLFVSFILMASLFIVATALATANDIRIFQFLAHNFNWTGGTSATALCLFFSFLSVSIILARCYFYGTIKKTKIGAVAWAFFIGAIVNAFLFRFTAFGGV